MHLVWIPMHCIGDVVQCTVYSVHLQCRVYSVQWTFRGGGSRAHSSSSHGQLPGSVSPQDKKTRNQTNDTTSRTTRTSRDVGHSPIGEPLSLQALQNVTNEGFTDEKRCSMDTGYQTQWLNGLALKLLGISLGQKKMSETLSFGYAPLYNIFCEGCPMLHWLCIDFFYQENHVHYFFVNKKVQNYANCRIM